MCFAVIMQHANMAYDDLTFEEGGGVGVGVVWVISEKNILKSDFEHKKVLQGNTCYTIALYVREKHSITRGLREINANYANP